MEVKITYSTKKIKVSFEPNPLRALLDISSRMRILREICKHEDTVIPCSVHAQWRQRYWWWVARKSRGRKIVNDQFFSSLFYLWWNLVINTEGSEIIININYTCHFTRMRAWSMIRKHDTVHQMNELSRVYCGQLSDISGMETRISCYHYRSFEDMLFWFTEFSFVIRVIGSRWILCKYLERY